jgi:hypothetical protein
MLAVQSAKPSSFHSKAKLKAEFPVGSQKTLCREYTQVRVTRSFVRKGPKRTRAIGFKWNNT